VPGRLAIHEGKTRLIPFGRRAARQRELSGTRGRGRSIFWASRTAATRPENGQSTVKKKTQSKRVVRKLKALRSEMKERLHLPMIKGVTGVPLAGTTSMTETSIHFAFRI
jgi:RNA-directed DNA polymerase